MYKWPVYYVPPNFTEFFVMLLSGKNSVKILWFLPSRSIFYALRLYVMTKNEWQDA